MQISLPDVVLERSPLLAKPRPRRHAARRAALATAFALVVVGALLALPDSSRPMLGKKKKKKKLSAWRNASATTPAAVPDGCATTLSVIRHCDKPKKKKFDDGHCTAAGFARARHVARLWGGGEGGRFAPPALLLARAPTGSGAGGGGVHREVETLEPLGEVLDLPVVTSAHRTQDVAAKIARVISRGQYCGASILVCWKHSYIVKLLKALDCREAQGCPAKWYKKDFDTIVRVRFALRRGHHHKFEWLINASTTRENFEYGALR